MPLPDSIGFIGVGDLAEYTITGLRRGGYQGSILLSPRNRNMSAKLAKDWQCEVMQTNQAVADRCEYLFLSTRPADSIEALAPLNLSDRHTLVSVVAGVSIARLEEVIGNPITIVRAMPVTSAKALASPTLVFPASEAVIDLFDLCGNSIIADSEDAFGEGSIIACVYTWYFELFNELIRACSSDALTPQLSAQLVMGMAKGAASVALEDRDRTPGEIAEAIATEGTFSKLGLDILRQDEAFKPWITAINRLKSQMR